MMKFEKNIDDRKVLVKRLEELTGLHSVYTFMPRSAFEIGQYTVERDGSLTVEEAEADTEVLKTLLDEGLIVGDLPEETNVETAESENAEAENADSLSISFPASQHTGNSLRNLIRLTLQPRRYD